MNRTFKLKFTVLVFLLVFSAVPSLMLGSADLTFSEVIGGLLRRDGYQTAEIILYSIRIPRFIAAVTAGAGLAVSGAILQTVIGNELASPSTIGVNAGAGLAVIICLSIIPTAVKLLPAAAFIGALITVITVLTIARAAGRGKSTIILAGIACTTLFQAAISFLSILDSDVMSIYSSFSVGSLSGVRTERMIIPLVLIITCTVAGICISGRIAALSLGDAVASSLGIRVRKLRIFCLILASICAASAISFAGLLGFVGLVAPHMTRKLVGSDIKALLSASPVLGAILVTLSDLAGRTVFSPSEIPVGIVMAFIGAPFFFILILRKGGSKSA